ncbi:MAG: DUF2924 domain-containing protein [Xanthobacteraceae bacterium]|nr:DUF2924 domain-containing protein [Xanthobacteraceae bacterium]MCW5678239.1 DUF2924 domain-containing protein [Xanthobacteraceae bacterium]
MPKQITRNAPGDDFSGGDTEARKREEIAAAIEEIRDMNKNQLRVRWKELFKKEVPKALTKDLLARMIAYRIQERAFGGLDRRTEKILESYANGKPTDTSRYLKTGTVVIREYQGVRHTVTIADGEYLWNGKRYASLSTIAKEITGTSWNGPRFFGLREKAPNEPDKQRNTAAGARP